MRERERERRETAVGKGRDSPRPDGATHSEMVPPIIKADLPSLLVLAHGGLANGEAALQPAAFAALQTYPGVGKCPPLTLHILCCYLGSIDKQKFPQTFPFFVFFFPSGFFHSFVDFSFQFFKLFFFSLSRISNTNNNTWLSSKKKLLLATCFFYLLFFFSNSITVRMLHGDLVPYWRRQIFCFYKRRIESVFLSGREKVFSLANLCKFGVVFARKITIFPPLVCLLNPDRFYMCARSRMYMYACIFL